MRAALTRWLIVLGFFAMYALVGTLEARDADLRQPLTVVAK